MAFRCTFELVQRRVQLDVEVGKHQEAPICVDQQLRNIGCTGLHHIAQDRCRLFDGQFSVLDNGKLIGVISIGDLVKDVICEQQFIISQLENYIHG